MNIIDITPSVLPSLALLDKGSLPNECSIYFAIDGRGTVLYIGQAQRLLERWRGHHRTYQLSHYDDVRIAWIIVSDAVLLDEIEAACIDRFNPILNRTSIEYPAGHKIKKMVTLSQDALDKLDALAANDTHKYNKSSVIEMLIHQAFEELSK